MSNCTIDSNRADSIAAGLYLESVRGSITTTDFINNTVGLHGGAVVLRFPNFLSISKCNFINNRAGTFAGALYIQ